MCRKRAAVAKLINSIIFDSSKYGIDLMVLTDNFQNSERCLSANNGDA